MANVTPYALHKKCIYRNGYTCNKNKLIYGNYGFMCMEDGVLKKNQIEATRVSIIRQTKKQGLFWVRVNPYLPLSKKPSEVRMGKGKGPFSEWVYFVQKNEIIFEFKNIAIDTIKSAYHAASVKFPYPLKLVICNSNAI